MRGLAVAALMGALAVAVLSPPPGRGGDDDARRYERAHAAAVKYRAQRDHVQALLAARVREVRDLRRALAHKPSSLEALRLAAAVYRVPFRLLYRIATCESTGPPVPDAPSERSLNPTAKNPRSTARGLAQALDTTWAASPFASFSVFSPYAAALFMGRQVSLGHLWQWAASRSCWS
jgi:hypothetical protein